MINPKWLLAIPAIAIAGGAIYATRHPAFTNDPKIKCVEIYADILPEDYEITTTRLDGGSYQLHYRHAGGEGSIVCDLDEQGHVDFNASMNRKIDVMWDNPDIQPRFD